MENRHRIDKKEGRTIRCHFVHVRSKDRKDETELFRPWPAPGRGQEARNSLNNASQAGTREETEKSTLPQQERQIARRWR